MNQANILMSVSAAALSLVFSLQPHPVPFWDTNIVIAADDTSLKGNVQPKEDSSTVESAKSESTQTGQRETVLACDK